MDRECSLCIICIPVKDAREIVPGSVKTICCRCGEPVWLAPSGIAMMAKRPNCLIVCRDCGIIMMAEEPGELLPFTEAQLRELEAWRRRSQTITG